jgi:hypothetical protein
MKTRDAVVVCAMTPRVIHPRLRDLAARTARVLPDIKPSEIQRAQGMPGARRAPRPRMQNKKAYEHRHHGHTGSPGIPRAMVLTVSSALSSVIGLYCHRHRRK